MTRYRATLAYDGDRYQGFQRQAQGIPTIQGAVESALAGVTGETVGVIGAGRTDTGVHATGQVIAFDVQAWRHGERALHRALNAALPHDIVLVALESLPQGSPFHPRFDAGSRLYKYHIIVSPERLPSLSRFAWCVRPPLDADALHAAAACVAGERDFGAFGHAPIGENTVRAVYHSSWQNADVPEAADAVSWRYTVEANAFLQHMVRRLVGHMIDVARGQHTLAAFQVLIEGARLTPNWTVAPPHGLTLVQVKYS
jgi:tRNA pseudouridine38-40 synthase